MADARIIHFEIPGRDAEALQAFWGNLFGWQLDTANPDGYGMTDPAATGLVVGIGAARDGGAGHVTGYVSVPDIDAALTRVLELRGSVVVPKFSPGGGATLAMVADPEGHVLGLTQA